MKAVSIFFLFLAFFSTGEVFSQTKVKPKTKRPPAEVIPYKDYSYPYYAIINNGPSPVSGCFINVKNQAYFVTTRHSFYTTTNEKRKITNVMIFIDPSNIKNSAKVLSLNMTDQELLPVCFDFGCTDIILLPVTIPRALDVNFVHLEAKDVLADKEKEMAIVGYVKDTLNIITTKFDSFLERDSTFFLTEKSSPMEQSGSPVLIHTKNKAERFTLAGIYSGKEISKEHFDKGLVSKASYITRFLQEKAKQEHDAKQKPIKPKKTKKG